MSELYQLRDYPTLTVRFRWNDIDKAKEIRITPKDAESFKPLHRLHDFPGFVDEKPEAKQQMRDREEAARILVNGMLATMEKDLLAFVLDQLNRQDPRNGYMPNEAPWCRQYETEQQEDDQ